MKELLKNITCIINDIEFPEEPDEAGIFWGTIPGKHIKIEDTIISKVFDSLSAMAFNSCATECKSTIRILPGETDSFGWLTGVLLLDENHKVVFG